uniref:Uncharacterized protein n=1 Tax=Glossina pallidipes TaxID=7398 RepID=A0A1A9ZNF8_GLOPL
MFKHCMFPIPTAFMRLSISYYLLSWVPLSNPSKEFQVTFFPETMNTSHLSLGQKLMALIKIAQGEDRGPKINFIRKLYTATIRPNMHQEQEVVTELVDKGLKLKKDFGQPSLTTAKEASKPKLTAKPDAVPRKRCGNTSEIMKNGKVNKPMVENTMCITIHMAGSAETLAKALGYQPDKANNSIHTVIPEAENMPAGLRPQRSNKELIKKVVIMRATPTITAQRKGSVDTPAAVAICTANTTTTTMPEHC